MDLAGRSQEAVISGVTDRLIPELKGWQKRSLEAIYPIVWLDAIHYRVQEDGGYVSKAVYNRGLEDILIACVDGLTGFPEATASIYPDTEVQQCVIHQIRSSMRHVASKHQKAFMADLKPVYRAATREAAETSSG